MKIVLLHDDVPANAREDELDVFVQCDAIEGGLRELGHPYARLPFTLNLAETRARLRELQPDAVFNLVEAVEGQGRLLPLASMLLDSMNLPYTGSHTEPLFVTTDKVLAKRVLQGAGIGTAAWVDQAGGHGGLGRDEAFAGRWIIKPVWEEASVGLDEDSVVEVRATTELRDEVRRRSAALGKEMFAERFIDGREFNLSVLAGPGGVPEVLPPAEIHFVDYAPDKPRVVGYRAKWDAASFEFHHTPRCFDFAAADQPLLEELTDTARRCWTLLDLRGYVRVDFRVDAAGRLYVLEVNANPCLAPDAGFYAATQQARLCFPDVVARILADAQR